MTTKNSNALPKRLVFALTTGVVLIVAILALTAIAIWAPTDTRTELLAAGGILSAVILASMRELWGLVHDDEETKTTGGRTLVMLLAIGLVAATVTACNPIRDPGVYRTELQYVDATVQRSAPAVRAFLIDHCTCDASSHAWTAGDDRATDDECADNASWYDVYRSRWSWHLGMMRYNGGVTSTDPGSPPDIVATCDVSPPGAQTAGSDTAIDDAVSDGGGQ